MDERFKKFDDALNKALRREPKVLGTYEAKIVAKTQKVIPKKFLVSKKIQKDDNDNYLVVTLWIPDTPEYHTQPAMCLTISCAGNSIRVYFSEAERFEGFCDAFVGFLNANKDSLVSAWRESVMEWAEIHTQLRAHQRSKVVPKTESPPCH